MLSKGKVTTLLLPRVLFKRVPSNRLSSTTSENTGPPIKLRYGVFGLGNPGDKYKLTRHNVGFMVIDKLAEKYDINVTNNKCNALLSNCWKYNDKAVWLGKPQTFMNLSGGSVRGAVGVHRIPKENVIVIYDDLHLPLGTLRVKDNGSSGGQNGVEDVINHLGKSAKFVRLRFGIGSEFSNSNREKYVLQKFTPDQEDLLKATIERAVLCVESIIDLGLDKTMNLFNKSQEDYEKNEKDKIKREKEKAKREAARLWQLKKDEEEKKKEEEKMKEEKNMEEKEEETQEEKTQTSEEEEQAKEEEKERGRTT
ncbi:peptidyl-tRNA hydrolase [Planoprotostelium fungivorum]|uniref:peptidyl-tRNA hydrolase n=1 Tax=Planoprotostelium fungivorum TaxID=1890364 RepID=A0A2P6N611_9EUKA|nr:peptidyl-tRNA hydrolase [Planoprotostelium fungivorum]